MKRVLLLLGFLLFSCTPTKFIPKDSEPLSRAVYATSDSIDLGRIDLADQYAKQAKSLVEPPKQIITIKPLLSKPSSKGIPKNVIVIPASLQGMQVIVVGSQEYEDLLKIKENALIMEKDVETLKKQIEDTRNALKEQFEVKSKLLKDYENLVLQLKDKDLALLKRGVIIAGLSLLIGIYSILKIKGLLPIPF